MGWFNNYQAMHTTAVAQDEREIEIESLNRKIESMQSTLASFRNRHRQDRAKIGDLGKRLADCESEKSSIEEKNRTLSKAVLQSACAESRKQELDRLAESEQSVLKMLLALSEAGCSISLTRNEDDEVRVVRATIHGDTRFDPAMLTSYSSTTPAAALHGLAVSLRGRGVLNRDGDKLAHFSREKDD